MKTRPYKPGVRENSIRNIGQRTALVMVKFKSFPLIMFNNLIMKQSTSSAMKQEESTLINIWLLCSRSFPSSFLWIKVIFLPKFELAFLLFPGVVANQIVPLRLSLNFVNYLSLHQGFPATWNWSLCELSFPH